MLGVLAIIIVGVISASKIPLDAVPDITNNQVQIVSTSPTLAPQEVEQIITYPLESVMTNIPGVEEVRSISRYGLSVITVVFNDGVDIMQARQFVQEQLNLAKSGLPAGLTEPNLMPITTGLGEIYQYVLTVEDSIAHRYDDTELRTIQDWIVKRQLNGTKGIIEVSSFGGYVKQYEVNVLPNTLKALGLSLQDVINALKNNNENSGGSYIEKGPTALYIRTEGRAKSISDIENIHIQTSNGVPIRIGDIGKVRIGSPKRYGAMTMDGHGEVVGGITLMLKGANSSEALQNVRARIEEIKKSLPPGVSIYPYLDRGKLIAKTIATVERNLVEGGIIVILVLMLFLGNFRAGLIVASTIPLSMLFALILMSYFGISANLMSLGAIDFGIVIDGAVIIVESLLHVLALNYVGKVISQNEMDEVVAKSAGKIYNSAAFGILVILVVFVPILTLTGIEGKTFSPMAQTVSFAILGSFILSLTYVPAMAALFISKKTSGKTTFSDKMVEWLKRLYAPPLVLALKWPKATIIASVCFFVLSILIFSSMGSEFVPTLEEGSLAMQQSIKPGSSLSESISTSTMAEKILKANFPEVEHVVSKIGTAEVPTDPMAIEDTDIMIILKDKEEWVSAKSKDELVGKMKEKLSVIKWASYEFSQPIQLRFNELMTGSKADISVKIYGENVATLKAKAEEAASIIRELHGAGDVKVDQTEGLQQLNVKYDHTKLAQYGIHIADLNQTIRAAYAGETVGNVFEEERKFDLVVRLSPEDRSDFDLSQLTIATNKGLAIPVSEVTKISKESGPMLISREKARRFINIGVNVRNTDIATLVEGIMAKLDSKLKLPPGYEIEYGGQFENLEHAKERLAFSVPFALLLILLLLYFAFGSVLDTSIIFIAVPLSAIGGILALSLRGMPFSISSGIGFIALFGVSVLNGIVLLSAIKQSKTEEFNSLVDLLKNACLSRLRPVLMTATVATLGFLPMAISHGSGAEVQRPLATVVMGGLVSSTLLTLMVLPTLYLLFYGKKWIKAKATLLLVIGISCLGQSQSLGNLEEIADYAIHHHPAIANIALERDIHILDKKMLGQWEPLQIGYQGGQINYTGFDHLISINQDISHLLGQKAQKELIGSKVALSDAERLVLAKELRLEIGKAYNDWMLVTAKAQQQDSLTNLMQRLEPKIKLQHKAGEIDLLTLKLFEQDLALARQHFSLAVSEALSAEKRLRILGNIPPEIKISPPLLAKINLPALDAKLHQHEVFRMMEAEKNVLEKEVAAQEANSRKPKLGMGYFAQTLEQKIAFQGLFLNVGVPLDRRVAKTKVEQLGIEKAKVDNQLKVFENRFQIELDNALLQIDQYEKLLATFDQSRLSNQSDILSLSMLQYSNGEIDFFQLSQIKEKTVSVFSNYLELVWLHNKEVINLLYLISSGN